MNGILIIQFNGCSACRATVWTVLMCNVFLQIINFYMNMLMERSKEKGFPSVHAFNTFFFTKLKTAGYQAVKRWTKKVDVFSVDILLVPIHLGVHWCLAVSSSFIFGDMKKKSTKTT